MLAGSSSPDTALLDHLADINAAGGLRERLQTIVDPRSPRGLRHSLMSIMLIVVCALAADKNGYTAIEAWARDAPPEVLTALGVRVDAFTAAHVCPDESTIRALLARIDPDDLAATGCAYLSDLLEGRTTVRGDVPDEREARRARAATTAATTATAATAVATAAAGGVTAARAYALDGKRLAGARRADGTHVNLLSMVCHTTGITLAQREIDAKTNEIPEVKNVLTSFDVTNAVLTLDALHTQRDTATLIVEHHAAYVLTIKRNQPNLHTAVAARFTAPNAAFVTAGRYGDTTNTGHGRSERREIRTADATGIDFPHAAQIFQIIRRSKPTGEQAWHRKEVVYGITALTTSQAGPADLAAHTRNHWSVENKSHYVRDVTFREDASQTRTKHAPANLATLRNVVIGAFRRAGHANLAHARSLHANSYQRVITLFNL